jgi:hypothetical protein
VREGEDRRRTGAGHWTTERDRSIAAAMSQIIEAELANPDSPSGTQRAREDHDDS